MWTAKYSPKKIEDFEGNKEAIAKMLDWGKNWRPGKKALIIHGPPGTGKTTSVRCLANSLSYELLEFNASDQRDKKSLEKIAAVAASSGTLSGKKRLILFDELDGLGSSDRGAASLIKKIISDGRVPIVLIANDIWDQKIKSLRNAGEKLQFRKLAYYEIQRVLEKICDQEKIKVEKEILAEMAKSAGGDLKSAINDLEAVAQGSERISVKDLEVLSSRDREKNIFYAMKDLFKARSFFDMLDSVKNLDERPEFIKNWIDENIPNEYEKVGEIEEAYSALVKADVYMGRILRRQYYKYLKYSNVMMTAGVSLAKDQVYRKFTRYAFPSFVMKLSKSKSVRKSRKEIGEKIAKQCHISVKAAIQDYFPLIKTMLENKEKSARVTAQFGFTEEDLEFFGIEKARELIKSAEKIKEENVNKKMDRSQKTLSFFS